MAYGKDTSTSATEIEEIRKFLKSNCIAVRPGAYLVDSVPWLKYIPWYGLQLKREGEMRRLIYTNDLNRVKEQLKINADIGPSFARYMLENEDAYGLTKTEITCLAGDLVDTTAMVICTVLMAAARFPEEQAKVQTELDAVLGSHRAPTFADENSLPHLYAFISETLRWRLLAPHGAHLHCWSVSEVHNVHPGIPHRTTKEVIWENYCIPAGTTVLGNHLAISRDPEVFPEPDEFKPDHWVNDPRDDLKKFTFSFGRHICPALHVANSSIFINSALVLWALRLALDPAKPLHDMTLMAGMPPVEEPCVVEFKTRISEAALRRIMKIYPEVA
ncbi:cytochrome P450 [Rhizopogon vinicolor AM-OR11-026]|uniref:Cytochrome P450 n=1 Tax=Rhizopogon vinicolor AM-OR11-026 TaxID=1314800 RepID=A0A1B7MKJ9_9AGAM|nr:cytochrome P450 [Rhizopogon vinicolor AM-OR11-026]